MIRGAATAAVLAVVMVGAEAQASTIAPGFNTFTLPANDDGSAGPVALGFEANFFGAMYAMTFVNNNGNLTFNSPQSRFTPTGIGAGYTGQPIIAPFFADVDTRGAGSGLTSYGTGVYDGHVAFGVNYPDVGYFSRHTDKLNDFQLLLVSRSDVGTGDFDIYFNYNQIQWETGDASGGHNGLGGTSAAAGFSNGTATAGTYYQLTGSLVNGAFLDGGPDALATHTNDGTPGQFRFEVRNGSVTIPVSPVPLPPALPLFGAALLGLGLVTRRGRIRLEDRASA